MAKPRRLADAIDNRERFVIQIAGERICVPVRAEFNIEHERTGDDKEIEFQIKRQHLNAVVFTTPLYSVTNSLLKNHWNFIN